MRLLDALASVESLDSIALNRICRDARITISDLANTATEIVLFGSRAMGVSQDESDVDFLCIGTGKSRLTPRLDVVWIAPSVVRERSWLGSELAGHICSYGKWLCGEGEWRGYTFCDDAAVNRKRERILRHMSELTSVWDCLSVPYRFKQAKLLRRDLQRLNLLLKKCTVPPTPILDRQWRDHGGNPAGFEELVISSELPPLFFKSLETTKLLDFMVEVG